MPKRTIQCYADETLLAKLQEIAAHYRRNISSTIRELVEVEYARLNATPPEKSRNLLGD